MADYVIKKDGTKEPFQEEKIRESVRAAAKEAGLPEERVEELVEEVGGAAVEMTEERETIPTTDIADFVVGRLEEEAPSAAEAWKRYRARNQ